MPSTHTNLLYHLVFSTKQRIPLIADSFQEEFYKYLGGIVRGEGGVSLEIGGMADHVHLLVKLKPTIALANFLRQLKANSSKWINEKMQRRKFGWQDGYAAFTVSESQATTVARYIQNQAVHHRRRDFKAELVALLKRNRVEYDARYLWD